MSLEDKFKEYANAVKNIQKKPSDENLLKLYSFYKQATVGDVNTTCPSMFNYVNYTKWNAWYEHKGKSKNDAMIEYIKIALNVIN
jgi:diazepam-binding inhibitor (GABA receptor modulator, acyl-CoA-binding protein)